MQTPGEAKQQQAKRLIAVSPEQGNLMVSSWLAKALEPFVGTFDTHEVCHSGVVQAAVVDKSARGQADRELSPTCLALCKFSTRDGRTLRHHLFISAVRQDGSMELVSAEVAQVVQHFKLRPHIVELEIRSSSDDVRSDPALSHKTIRVLFAAVERAENFRNQLSSAIEKDSGLYEHSPRATADKRAEYAIAQAIASGSSSSTLKNQRPISLHLDLDLPSLTPDFLLFRSPELARNLAVLHLEDNKLTSLCDEIASLGALRTLRLSRNFLSEFPPCLCSMERLEELHLDLNRLSGALPPDVGRMASLKLLNLAHNRITELPDELSECKQLETLLVLNNDLLSLPPSLVLLPNLYQLQAFDNPRLVFPPTALVRSGFQAIMNCMRQFCPKPIVAEESSILRDMAALLHSGQLCDVVVCVGQSEFSCHRIVLCQSQKLRDLMLRAANDEERDQSGANGCVRVRIDDDIEPDTFARIVDYYYGKDIPFQNEREVSSMLARVEEYRLHAIAEAWEAHRNGSAATETFVFVQDPKQYAARLIAVRDEEWLHDFTIIPAAENEFEETPNTAGAKGMHSEEEEQEEESQQSHTKNNNQEGAVVRAHKAILWARSEHFRSLLSLGLKEAQEGIARMQGVDPAILAKTVRYMYGDEWHMRIEADDAIALLRFSNGIGQRRLQSLCERTISRFLDVENAAGLLELADRLGCTQLRVHCLFFLRSKLSVVEEVLKEQLNDYLPKNLQDEVRDSTGPGSVFDHQAASTNVQETATNLGNLRGPWSWQ